MFKKIIFIFYIMFILSSFKIYAQPNVINLYEKTIIKHKKSSVLFTHQKHINIYKINCGMCHHDKNHNPLNDLKMSDKVQKCIKCHSLKGKNNYKYVIHKKCKSCHKTFNKAKTGKIQGIAPVSCKQCHKRGKYVKSN